jgi:hypothetical protein
MLAKVVTWVTSHEGMLPLADARYKVERELGKWVLKQRHRHNAEGDRRWGLVLVLYVLGSFFLFCFFRPHGPLVPFVPTSPVCAGCVPVFSCLTPF